MADNFEKLGFSEEKAPATDDFGALGFTQQPNLLQTMLQRGMVPGDGGLIGQIRAAQGVRPFLREALEPPAATLAGGLGEAQRLMSSLAQRQPVSAGRFPQRLADIPQLQKPMQQVQQVLAGLRARRPEQAQVGKTLADIGAFAGTEEAAAPLLGGLGGAGLLARLARRGVAGFPAGAAVSPDNRLFGGFAGSLAAAAPEATVAILKGIPKMDVVLRSRLGQRVISGFEKAQNKATELYNKAFEGTEGITPKLTDETEANIKELNRRYPGERGDVPRALQAYKDNKSLQNLHFLRSNLGDEWAKLERDKTSPTVRFTKQDEADQEAVEDTRKNINKSLENNFNKLNPDKKAQYDQAQKHFENNVAPFRQKGHTAIIKALSPDRDITNKLFNEIGADSIKASKVRNVLGLSRSQLEAAKLLRNKLITFPAIGAALGTGLFFGGRHIL
jgi:hypothetical protein